MNEEKEKKLIIHTKQSFYDPIEITIDDQVYQSEKLTRAFLDELNKLDKDVIAKKDEALYKIVRLMFNVDAKILDILDRREVEDIYLFSKRRLAEIDQERLKVVVSTYKNLMGPKKQGAKETIPNRKRPGNRR